MVSEAGTQARALADEARSALRQQASDGTTRAAGAVDQLAGNFRALAEGNTEQAGDLQRYVRDLGDRLGGVAGRLQERGLDGAVDDLQSFARRRPGLFLAAAAGAGFAAGRLFRGSEGRGRVVRRRDGHVGQRSRRRERAAGSRITGHHRRRARRVEPGRGGRPDHGPAGRSRADPGAVDRRAAARGRAERLPRRAFRDTGAERAGPDGGTTPAPTPYGGATGGSGGLP